MEKEVIKYGYPIGAYVVLLTLNGKELIKSSNSIPTDYCYRLREEFIDSWSPFRLELDANGSKANGYSSNEVIVRLATLREIEEYKKLGHPYDIRDIKDVVIDTYQIY